VDDGDRDPLQFRGLKIPGPAAIAGRVQLAFATPMVFAQLSVAAPSVIVLASVYPRGQEAVVRFWMRGVLRWSGISLRVRGLENLDHSQRYVTVSNHQSIFDVPCINTALPIPIRFVAKRSLAKVPLFGPGMRAVGTVDIDRHDRADTTRRLREAKDGIGQKASIHFFAEGTRSPDGQLQAFKKGAAAMALSLGVPLVPIALSDTRDIFPKGSLKLQPMTVTVTVGKPIPVSGEDNAENRARLTEEVREAVRALLALPA